MGLLDKLWDDTVAGPRPETGLGRLRRFPPFPIRTDLSKEEETPPVETPPPRVTRSIMIRKPTGTPPESPAGATPPTSPFLGKETLWSLILD